MKNKFKLSAMLLFLVVLTLALTSCGKKEDKEEKQEESKVEKISEDEAEFVTVFGGEEDDWVYFNQHDVKYDTNLGGNEITIAQEGVLLYEQANYKRYSREELEKCFTSWGCKVIEQKWSPTISETGEVIEEFEECDPVPFDFEVVKTFLKDDHIEVILYDGVLYYDLYNVYFVDGKIDNIEHVRGYDEEQYVETYGDIFD